MDSFKKLLYFTAVAQFVIVTISLPSTLRLPHKVQTDLHRRPATTIETQQSPDWMSSTVLPRWMKEYFLWHQQQLQHLHQHQDQWNASRYYVLRCLKKDPSCNGLSDRLHPMPVHIALASMYKRILFIKWEEPARLEEFLVPPRNGLNWSIPSWLDSKLTFPDDPMIRPKIKGLRLGLRKLVQILGQNSILVDSRFCFYRSHGAHLYNFEMRDAQSPLPSPSIKGVDKSRVYKYDNSTFEEVFREVWSALFQPSPAVQSLIDKEMTKLGLQPNNYDALHIRSQYLDDESGLVRMIRNATKCGLSFKNEDLSVQPKLFIASDSNVTTQLALQFVNNKNKNMQKNKFHVNRNRWSSKFSSVANAGRVTTAVARNLTQSPFHLNYRSNNSSHVRRLPPAAYYDTFVDLYLLSMSRCTSFGRGSFGMMANLMSKNHSCYRHYFRYRFLDKNGSVIPGAYVWPKECSLNTSPKLRF